MSSKTPFIGFDYGLDRAGVHRAPVDRLCARLWCWPAAARFRLARRPPTITVVMVSVQTETFPARWKNPASPEMAAPVNRATLGGSRKSLIKLIQPCLTRFVDALPRICVGTWDHLGDLRLYPFAVAYDVTERIKPLLHGSPEVHYMSLIRRAARADCDVPAFVVAV